MTTQERRVRLPLESHLSMATLSYVWPSAVETGSRITSCVIGTDTQLALFAACVRCASQKHEEAAALAAEGAAAADGSDTAATTPRGVWHTSQQRRVPC